MGGISAEWVAALVGVASAAGYLGNFIRARIEQSRREMPLIRHAWATGPKGHNARVEFVNRLDEDISVNGVECKSRFVISKARKGGSPDEPKLDDYEFVATPRKLDFTILAGQSKKLSISIDGPETPRWLRFTVSSNAKTLRGKKYVIRGSEVS